jgi:hypothetical protein
MAPPVTLNWDITDHFPIYELDGTTKHSGVTGLTAVIWFNGAVMVGFPHTLAEIGSSGEYLLSFTATDKGLWSWEVTNTYNDDVYGGSQLVTRDNVKFEMTASDNGVVASFGIWMTKDGDRVTDLTSMVLNARSSLGSVVHPFGTNTSCTSQGVFKFTCSAGLFYSDVEYYLDVVAIRTSPYGAWRSNLGFTKV